MLYVEMFVSKAREKVFLFFLVCLKSLKNQQKFKYEFLNTKIVNKTRK